MKVYQLENKNQFIIFHNGHVYFQSYESLIADYYYDQDKEKHILKLGYCWDYSKTTLKHLYLFIANHTFINFEKFKGSYKNYIQKLIDDGEILYDEEMR